MANRELSKQGLAVYASADHHIGIGSCRGFSFDAWLHGSRVAEAWHRADYYFRSIKPPVPKQGVLV